MSRRRKNGLSLPDKEESLLENEMTPQSQENMFALNQSAQVDFKEDQRDAVEEPTMTSAWLERSIPDTEVEKHEERYMIPKTYVLRVWDQILSMGASKQGLVRRITFFTYLQRFMAFLQKYPLSFFISSGYSISMLASVLSVLASMFNIIYFQSAAHVFVHSMAPFLMLSCPAFAMKVGLHLLDTFVDISLALLKPRIGKIHTTDITHREHDLVILLGMTPMFMLCAIAIWKFYFSIFTMENLLSLVHIVSLVYSLVPIVSWSVSFIGTIFSHFRRNDQTVAEDMTFMSRIENWFQDHYKTMWSWLYYNFLNLILIHQLYSLTDSFNQPDWPLTCVPCFTVLLHNYMIPFTLKYDPLFSHLRINRKSNQLFKRVLWNSSVLFSILTPFANVFFLFAFTKGSFLSRFPWLLFIVQLATTLHSYHSLFPSERSSSE